LKMKTFNISIILIILLSAACKNGEVKSTSSETIRVKVTGVIAQAIAIPVHSNGILVSSEELKLSFKTGGIVSEILVGEGEQVKKGDLLASLNLSEISANAEQAKSSFDKAVRDYRRAENLYKDSVATLEQKQNAATALNVAKLNLDIVQFNLIHSTIIAPDNGLILKQFVKANELVSAGSPVFLFGSSGKSWKVKAGLSDKDIIKINTGDSASVSFDAYPGLKFPAVIDQVGGMSNPYTGTYEIELLLNKSVHRLASGFVAVVDLFPSSRKSFFVIPVESIVEADGYQGYIYAVTGNMTVKKVRIEIETLIGSMAAVKDIPEGITEVVSEGAGYLKEGMKVEVVK
jgi:multidrug efflux system membrane fusion protein